MNNENISIILKQHEDRINKLTHEAAIIRHQLDKVIEILDKLVAVEKATQDNE